MKKSLARKDMQHATLLVASNPELQAVPFSRWAGARLSVLGNFLRFFVEHVLDGVACVAPLLLGGTLMAARATWLGSRRFAAFLPSEYWLGMGLFAATVGLLLL